MTGSLAAVALGLPPGLAAVSPALAQDRPALRGVDQNALSQRDQEFEALQAERKKAAEAEAKLREEIDALTGDRRKLNEQLIETAARVRHVEQRIGTTEARLQPLDEKKRQSARRSMAAAP